MNGNKKLKAAIRERRARTNESYTDARMHVLAELGESLSAGTPLEWIDELAVTELRSANGAGLRERAADVECVLQDGGRKGRGVGWARPESVCGLGARGDRLQDRGDSMEA